MSYMYNEVSVAKVILLFYFTLLEELAGNIFWAYLSIMLSHHTL